MIGFALCHGWSFDAQSMAPLQAALQTRLPHASFASFDLGFTNAPQAPLLAPDTNWIAVGHSYGYAWLMQQDFPWRAAVSINGFTRFCRAPGRPQGTPLRLLDAMLARLEQDAHATVQDFQERCGMPGAALDHLDQAALLAHLTRLRDLDLAPPPYPTLALASETDAIVPLVLTEACFTQENCTLQTFPGNHVRLLREPQVAATAIHAFVEAIHA